MRNLPQFAKIPRGISTVLPCYYIGFHALLWKLSASPLLAVLVPRLDGLGHQLFFPDLGFLEGCCIKQPAVVKALP